MPTSSLQDTVASIGFAKVIVALQGTPASTMAAAVQTKSSIEDYFMIPDMAQAESLATSASHFASRKFKRAEPPTSRRVRIYPNLGLALGYVDATGLASLEGDPQVRKVEKAPELSLIRPVVVEDAKLGVGPTWGIKRLKIDQLWAAGFTGKGVLVGHLDTGVDASHSALAGAIGKFAEFDMAGDKVPNAKPSDSGEHGTHTAGTIVGRSGLKGQFGVAPEAQLASAMVIEFGQVIDRILGGMDWVIGEGVRIMSMSLGLRGFTPAFQTIIDALRAANVLPVIAVGNDHADSSRSPGNYANVLSIGAMDSSDQVPDFSSSQQFNRPVNPLCPALVGPGVDVLSCVPGGKFKMMNGTSMATPHVAGLAALLLQAKPSASANDLEQAIVGSCTLPAGMPQARGSHGVPDAVRAFQLLMGSPLPVVATAAAAPPRRVAKRGARGKTPVRAPGRTAKKRQPAAKKAAASKRKRG